jgi:hypothetical protein
MLDFTESIHIEAVQLEGGFLSLHAQLFEN